MTEHATQPTPEQAETARAIAARRFARCDTGHPAVAAMVRLCEHHTAAALAAGHPHAAPAAPAAPAPPFPLLSADPFSILRGEAALPALPSVYAELQKVIADDDASAGDVAAVISKDPGLAAFLLRLVNSAFYSFPSQIDTITRAVTVVGRRQLSTLALGTTVMRMFKDVPGELADVESFWRHSIATGILARALARRIGDSDPERAFVAGLLHDLGRLALLRAAPDKATRVLAFSREHGLPVSECETGMLGFDHATLGGMLARKWNLPFPLVDAVLHHHTPATSKRPTGPAVLHVANMLALCLDAGSSGETFVQPLSLRAWDALGLEPEALGAVAADCREQIDSATAALLQH